jgi:transcriptional regulator with XRE-family HTH domain
MKEKTPPPPSRKPTFLREWRKFRKMSQAVACERMGIVKQGTLSKIERGELPYNQDFLEQAALAYGCDAVDLIAVNPLQTDSLKSIFSILRTAPPETQRRVIVVIDALLKAS